MEEKTRRAEKQLQEIEEKLGIKPKKTAKAPPKANSPGKAMFSLSKKFYFVTIITSDLSQNFMKLFTQC